MGKENTAGLGVTNVYGPREVDEARVSTRWEGGQVFELEVAFRGDNYTLIETPAKKIPAGSKVLDAYLEVKEVFALGGTTPTINVGTDGSAATNGVDISEAQAEATGVYDLTPQGTWASVLAADTTIAVELGGTSPTITSAGHAVMVIRYIDIG